MNPLDALQGIEDHLQNGGTFKAASAGGYHCTARGVEPGVYVVIVRNGDGSLVQTSGAAGLENLLQVMAQYAPREQWTAE